MRAAPGSICRARARFLPYSFELLVAIMDETRNVARPSRVLLAAAVFALLLGAYLLDLSTGNEVSSSLFYILPIAFSAWFLGRSPGVFAALVSAVEWYLAQRAVGGTFPSASILYWNIGAETAIYVTAALVIARVRADREREHRSAEQLALAHEALDRETSAVGALQRQLLPRQFPELDGYQWAVHYETSSRAGGDYYDFLRVPDGRIGVFVGDATGHGAPAAVLMAMTRALLHNDPDSFAPPGRLLERLNRQLSRALPEGWFLTACYLVLDPRSGAIEYSLAGHEAPLLVHQDRGDVRHLEDCGGPPLGPFPAAVYDTRSASLAPGDTLVLFTDGLTEAIDSTLEMFGVARLVEALRLEGEPTADDTMRSVLAALRAHTAAIPLRDDATVLIFRRLSASPVARAGTTADRALHVGQT
jgi:serine phosphatase RsbU (regulator of sigma subunit)